MTFSEATGTTAARGELRGAVKRVCWQLQGSPLAGASPHLTADSAGLKAQHFLIIVKEQMATSQLEMVV